MFGVNNCYMPIGCGFPQIPLTGLDIARVMQTPRYSVFDTNIFGYTPPLNFCAMPPFGYSTPNAFLQPFDFMLNFFSNPFGNMNFFGFMPQINQPQCGIFGGITGLPTPSYPTFPTPSITTSGDLLDITSRSSRSTSSSSSASTTRKTEGSTTTPTRKQPTSKTAPSVQKAIELANSQVGVKEVRNNDSEQIRIYKNGAINGNPWCCSFVSWLYGAGQNSDNSKTFGYCTSSLEVRSKAKAAGHYAAKNSGYTPKIGDLIVFDHTKSGGKGGHIGIITKVNSDGTFETIEGNYSNSVSRVHRTMNSSDLDGFVKMNEWLNA